MNLSNLQPAEGSVHNQNKRVGRGEGSPVKVVRELGSERRIVTGKQIGRAHV